MEAIRPFQERVVLVVNKVDNEQREVAAWAYYEYGIEAVVPVSAEHGRNMDALVDEIRHRLPGMETSADAQAADAQADEAGAPAATGSGTAPADATLGRRIRVAVMGKPNAGKSTLTNALLGSDASLVSETPGTTRDVVAGRFSHSGSEFEILDTAGIRRKNRVENDVEYYSVNRAIGTIEEADVVLLLIDATEGLSDQDKKIASLVVDRGRGLILVLNKWDLFGTIQNAFQAVRDRINFVFPVLNFAPIVAVSSTERTGFETLIKQTKTVYRQLTRRVDTGPLNQQLQRWVEETPPPMVGGRRLKLRYMTQVSVEPVVFVVFANRTRHVPDSYLGYIRNKIRKDLKFSHIPFRLELRGSG